MADEKSFDNKSENDNNHNNNRARNLDNNNNQYSKKNYKSPKIHQNYTQLNHNQKKILEIPKNVNDYRHILSNSGAEKAISWMINLRNPTMNVNTLKEGKNPSFYYNDLDKYKTRKLVKNNKECLQEIQSGNSGGFVHLLQDRPGEKVNGSQLNFETSLRFIKRINNTYTNKSPNKSNNKYTDFIVPNFNYWNTKKKYPDILPPLMNTSLTHLQKMTNKKINVTRPFDLKVEQYNLQGKNVRMKKLIPSNSTSSLMGEHNKGKYDMKLPDRNVNNCTHIIEDTRNFGKIKWISSLRDSYNNCSATNHSNIGMNKSKSSSNIKDMNNNNNNRNNNSKGKNKVGSKLKPIKKDRVI